jgi:hypothetical protein
MADLTEAVDILSKGLYAVRVVTRILLRDAALTPAESAHLGDMLLRTLERMDTAVSALHAYHWAQWTAPVLPVAPARS